MSEQHSAEWGRLQGVVTNMRALANKYHSLRHFVPWRAQRADEPVEDWPVGSVKRTVIDTGAADSGDWIVTTADVPASMMNGATAEEDAKAIAALHNVWGDLVGALEAIAKATGKQEG